MKYFIYTLLILSLLLAGFNITQIDYGAPFSSNSFVAIIATIAAVCVMIISLILIVSKRIEKIQKGVKS